MTALRLAFAGLITASTVMAQSPAWAYLPPDASPVVAFEWRKVLDSPYSEVIRREIPVSVSPLLGGINFVEGIERVLVGGGGRSALLVLEGRFDAYRLREMATSDGGVSKPYKKAELLLPAGDEESGTQMAVIGDSIVLLGDRATMMAAIDRATANATRPASRASGADLWVFERAPGPGVELQEFALFIRDGLRLDSRLRATSIDVAQIINSNARLQELVSTQTDAEVRIAGQFHRDEFARKMGSWRVGLQQLATTIAPPMPERKDRKVRIIGLDDGPREVQLTKPK
jgi:hypothetical protein